jgi:hypothetical protein
MHALLIHGWTPAIILFKHLTSLHHDAQTTAHEKNDQPFSCYHTIKLLVFRCNASL